MIDRLQAIDEAYLLMEQPNAPLHVASVGIFEGAGLCTPRGRLRLATIRHRMESRLGQLPRMRQRVMDVPFGIGRPVWVDDEDFDIAHHVDAIALGRRKDETALMRVVEDIFMERLDRSRPLWHLRFITGLEGGRIALVERAHHAMIDGVSGVDVSLTLLDVTADAGQVIGSPWVPQAPPSQHELLAGAVAEMMSQPSRLARSTLNAARQPGIVAAAAADARSALGALRRSGVVAPATSLRGELGPTRQLTLVRQRLDAVRRVATKHEATINDVALAAVAGGLRDLFLARGEALRTDRLVNVLVPVSVRMRDEANALGNRVGGLITPLPVGLGDPFERLRMIATTTRALKQSGEAATADRLLQMIDLLPPWIGRQIVRSVNSQPLVSMVVTNIPGPDFPLYALGSRMLEAFPVVPLGAGMTLEVALLSYDGQLNVSVTADREACPDSDIFTAGLEHAFAALGTGWTSAIA